MGMFDYVHYRCPKCKEIVEEQSKASSCSLIHYAIGDIFYDLPVFTDCFNEPEEVLPAPPEIIAEATRYGLDCTKCGHKTKPVQSGYVFMPYEEE